MHEALDQFGALVGPLAVAAVFAVHGDFRVAFALLAVPAALMLALLIAARLLYPRPEEMDSTPPDVRTRGLPSVLFLYLGPPALVAAGFVDFPLVAYHFQREAVVSGASVPIFYSVAMGVSGTGSLVFGRLFDRLGIRSLVPLTIVSALFGPLMFLGGFWPGWSASRCGGLGMGVHESIVPAAVALMGPKEGRASAYGLFTAGYGLLVVPGQRDGRPLYGVSVPAVLAFCLLCELAALPVLLAVGRRIAPACPGRSR